MKPICKSCKRKYFHEKSVEKSSVTIHSGHRLLIGSGNSSLSKPNKIILENCPNCGNNMEKITNQKLNISPEVVMLFGAGASTGSCEIDAPPLGKYLFGALAKFDPNGWGCIPESKKVIFEDEFENGMKILAEENGNLLPFLQNSMAKFFFKYIPTKENLYIKLCKIIKENNISIGFTSLNYERLLELALFKSELDIDICLPHGCCNIFCDGASTDNHDAEFSGIGITTTGLIYSINDEIEFHKKINNDLFPPVMCYFEPLKRVTSGINFINEQKSKWADYCTKAKTIVIIGIKPRIHDEHIWKPLAVTQAKIVYCGGKDGLNDFNEWKLRTKRVSQDIVLNGHFKEEFDKICMHIGAKL